MDRARRALGRTPPASIAEYEPLAGADDADSPTLDRSAVLDRDADAGFSWFEYAMFVFLGVAMLWAWNMFLAAAPYFASRFTADPWIEANFQSAILTVSTLTNLGTLVVLTTMQRAASYPFRINLALVTNSLVFALLTCSTALLLDAAPGLYLVFLLAMVALTSWATGLIQNGAFAFAASFARPEYTQALMAGQGVAGVLPAVAQVATVLLFPPRDDPSSRVDGLAGQGEMSAFVYFLPAVIVSVAALAALIPLVPRHHCIVESRVPEGMTASMTSIQDAERAARKVSSLWHLFGKLRWLALGVALTFTVTMFFPVFTAKIVSVQQDVGPLFRPAAFIPLAFLFWNLGDLAGRVATALPFSLRHRPAVLFLLSAVRIAQLPLYFLCNIGGRGAAVSSDFFYLFVVQFLFGLSNGWLGSSFMMASGEWVDPGEREATGGFMGLFLVIGLTVGSLLSFTV
ncbi:nucleoside transporter family [Ophiocordyceps sinensis CO18]|uniref:Nucleoside transporter family n=1 Tax=Ophiocordyceps sinensis (strain Co18 / CGMCC 3.14243) TaxID=911162 RepID=T5ANP9_OPHSC|nr:nucleoside transporter family [Ophiocordyceps sinensis CO18]